MPVPGEEWGDGHHLGTRISPAAARAPWTEKRDGQETKQPGREGIRQNQRKSSKASGASVRLKQQAPEKQRQRRTLLGRDEEREVR